MPAERALERRVVTALFADLAGFTTLGESLDPEDLRAVQDAELAATWLERAAESAPHSRRSTWASGASRRARQARRRS